MVEVKTTDGRLLNVDEATARNLIAMGFATPHKREVAPKEEAKEKISKFKVK